LKERKSPLIKFVNFHGHSNASIFDGLGYPHEHLDFAYDNGVEALALTDHGNMNNLPYQIFHAKKMNAEGKKIKPLYGVEAYFTPSISEWEKAQEEWSILKKTTKEEDDNKLVIEDESTKKGTIDEYDSENEEERKLKRIIKDRRHLVLIAMNQEGLYNIFTLVSLSHTRPYFYKFPRVDYEALRTHSGGVLATSACLTADSLLETNLGQMTIEEVIAVQKTGEEVFVLSYCEDSGKVSHKKVLWGDMTRENTRIVKIKLADGKELRLTPDHKVFTDKGWVEAGQLKNFKKIKILSLK